jgi:hypothetical protein
VNNPTFVANVPEAAGAVPLPGCAEGLFFYNWTGHHGAAGGISSNYYDIQPFGWLDAYANPLVYDALLSMSDIETYLGNMTAAARYSAMADKLRIAYSATFWDNVFGRFVGDIDAWGIKHDYGFTFVNQQAAYAGLEWGRPLINATQAYLMYNWMKNEPTGSGLKDTFTKWQYAPRLNTEINSFTINNRTVDDAWWLGDGTPNLHSGTWRWSGNEGQLQNGGSSMYTSYLDLMARNAFLGTDDCEKRLRDILARWSLPDHLCGGNPLYTGETHGPVGTDVPFPESGIVPAIMIFGTLGAAPKWQAGGHVLVLNSTLPSSWNAYTIRNMYFDYMMINVTVNTTCIRVEFPTSVLTDPTLKIEVNGTQYLISTHADVKGVVKINYAPRHAEKVNRWTAANIEYNIRMASGQTLNITGNNGLKLIPSITDANFNVKLDSWWNETMLLMTSEERSKLLPEMQVLEQATDVSSPLVGVNAMETYDAVLLQRKEAQDSYNRGDLRWTVANYRQANVIALRLARMIQETLPIVALQYVAIPLLAGLVVVVAVRWHRTQRRKRDVNNIELEIPRQEGDR